MDRGPPDHAEGASDRTRRRQAVQIDRAVGEALLERSKSQRPARVNIGLSELDEAAIGGQRREARVDGVARQRIEHDVNAIALRRRADLLGEVTGETGIGPQTRLDTDLVLDSLEVAALGLALRERYGVDLPAFIAGLTLDQIIELSVSDVAGFVEASRR